jgi:DNA-binding GntR family transcriptional regulator
VTFPLAVQTKKVYEIIRSRILDGTYSPMETLVESTLAADLGASRTTVKKALMKLVSEGLVVVEANKSARVKSLTVEEAVHYLEIRERLEGLIAYKVAQVITEKELNTMQRIFSEMEKCLHEQKLLEYSNNNTRFHEVLYNACPNREVVELVLSIKLQLRRYNVKTVLITGRDKESLKEHAALLETLKNRDPDGAERMMRRHISNVRTILKDNYKLLF